MAKISRDRVVAASVFHIIRAYLSVYRGEESFKALPEQQLFLGGA